MTKTNDSPLEVRRADDRFHSDLDWLNSRHTFSFGDHYDPAFMGFEALRVINDDRVAPNQGFGEHAHAGMEIISYVNSGEIQTHGETLSPGDGAAVQGPLGKIAATKESEFLSFSFS